jgi:hypothetical protein
VQCKDFSKKLGKRKRCNGIVVRIVIIAFLPIDSKNKPVQRKECNTGNL